MIRIDNNIVYGQTFGVLKSLQTSVNEMKYENRGQFLSLKNDMELLKDGLLEKEVVKRKTMPTRDEIPKEVFLALISASLEKNEQRLAHARFKIGCVLLYYSGLRVNEIMDFTFDDIRTIIETLEL